VLIEILPAAALLYEKLRLKRPALVNDPEGHSRTSEVGLFDSKYHYLLVARTNNVYVESFPRYYFHNACRCLQKFFSFDILYNETENVCLSISLFLMHGHTPSLFHSRLKPTCFTNPTPVVRYLVLDR